MANNAWITALAWRGRAIAAGTAFEWDGCMLFSCVADKPGEVGIRKREYQGNPAVVTGPALTIPRLAHRVDSHTP